MTSDLYDNPRHHHVQANPSHHRLTPQPVSKANPRHHSDFFLQTRPDPTRPDRKATEPDRKVTEPSNYLLLADYSVEVSY